MVESNETGKVIVAASLAAGAVGTAVAALNGRRTVHADRLALEIDLGAQRKELEQLTSAIESRRNEFSSLLASASERGRKSVKNTKASDIDFDALQSMDWGSLSKRARKGLERARSEAAKRAPADTSKVRGRVVEQGTGVVKSAKSFGEHLAEEFQRVAPDLKATLEYELAPRARTAAKRAADVGAVATDFGDKAKERLDGLTEDLLPGAQKQAERAADVVRTQVEQARPVVGEAARKASDVVKASVSDARPHAEELAARAKETAKHAPDAFADELKRAETALSEFAGVAQQKSAVALDVAEEKAKAGAMAAKDGTKEGTSFLFWSGAAASVIYFGLLNDDQRDKVKAIVTTVLGEVRDIANDIRGEDGSFTS